MATSVENAPIEIVAPAGTILRLDVFLVRHFAGTSRRTARELIAAGAVRVNGRRARKSHSVSPGDTISVCAPALSDADLMAEPDLPVTVLFENPGLVVVDKPAGMPTLPRRPNERGCVANFLVGRYPEMRNASPRRLEAGLVHRLDTATSGALLAARTPAAYATLRRQFGQRAVAKDYLALVVGRVTEGGRIELPVAHVPRHARRMCVCPQPDAARALRARPATTTYRPIVRTEKATLLAVGITTGVRHQVRVHLASVGHPIVGDELYGALATITATRLGLHAFRIRLANPVDDSPLEVVAQPPPDYRMVLRQWLGSEPPRAMLDAPS